MEQNLQVITKRIWHMMRVAYFMLRKGISKSKLMFDLNLMMKRGKLAGKAIGNLMFHPHHHYANGNSSSSRRSHHHHLSFVGPTEYEFSCSNSPAFPTFNINKRRHHHHHHQHNHFFTCTHAPDTLDDDMAAVNAVKAVMDMLNSEVMVEASPALPGFGRSPMVRQLRITDSPFPLHDNDEDRHVDKAAEEFIKKFYKELRLQKTMTE